MKYLSVCSGIEAASVASAPLGWKPVGFAEIDPFPCAVLNHHYPDVPNLGDMTKYQQWPDMDIDLLCGGTPCQAFSVAGKRGGLKDERGNLALVFCSIADRYNPKWIMWENVPGVLSSKDNAFGCFLAELCGSDAPIEPVSGRWPNTGVVAGPKRSASWRVIDAQFARVDGFRRAVPQRRRRLLVVGHTGDAGRAATVLFEPESLCGHSPPRRETREEVGKRAGIRAPQGFRMRGFGDYVADTVAGTLKARDYKDATDLILSCAAIAPCMTSAGPPYSRTGNSFVESDALVVHGSQDPCMSRGVAHTVGRNNGLENVVMLPIGVRRLMPVECERLMGFPDHYTRIPWRGRSADECPDGPRYKALGNSWAVNCARWVFNRIDAIYCKAGDKRQLKSKNEGRKE